MHKNTIGKIGMKDERDWNALTKVAGRQDVPGHTLPVARFVGR